MSSKIMGLPHNWYIGNQLYGTDKNVSMGKIKESSTNFENRQLLQDESTGIYAANLIGGQWTLFICCRLLNGKLRFSELKRKIPKITERMLTLQLRKLEENGIVVRTVYAEVPPRVEYELSGIGKELEPLMLQLEAWGAKHQEAMKNTKS
ncbi:helix-turn-helix domain-containing protein [Algoriphagus sp. NG3]|uniref:winged helix-turn-helix transcriptional regulator n=1 Tax=Algoriphagus sp. NG3 TaxID=3097546 RepID=UPI002A836692|nr:helix-turn-helix domain-containing protein [Algoriphagus sp. NG3]WPR77372.1 helix-turn-helix domain-containing protein [Algoriphagus sp. NG3]